MQNWNYIEIFISGDIYYDKGFNKNGLREVDTIIVGDIILGGNDELSVKANTEIILYFNKSLQNLDN